MVISFTRNGLNKKDRFQEVSWLLLLPPSRNALRVTAVTALRAPSQHPAPKACSGSIKMVLQVLQTAHKKTAFVNTILQINSGAYNIKHSQPLLTQ